MIEDQIAALNTQLFAFIASGTTYDDRRSLLAIHNGIAARGRFSYLEIGSHLGGTLQVLLADPRCVQVVSIDPRSQWQPDDRLPVDGYQYSGNGNERMLRHLEAVPGADLSKLKMVEESAENLAATQFDRPDFCFVDGEHTYRGALRDARFCRSVIRGAGIIAFHDSHVIQSALLAFLRETERPHRAYPLRSSVFVVELGGTPTLLTDPYVRAQLARPRLAWILANRVAAVAPLLALEHKVRNSAIAPARPRSTNAIRWMHRVTEPVPPALDDPQTDVPATAGSGPHGLPTQPLDEYAARIVCVEPELRMGIGEERMVRFEVSNLGSEPWPWEPHNPSSHQVRFAYHWLDADGGLVEFEGMRSAIPEQLRPGETCIVTARIRTPPLTGRYILEVDLVHEFVRWFGCGVRHEVDIAPEPEHIVYTADYYRETEPLARSSARVVVPWLVDILHPKSVVDVGCGTGVWLSEFVRLGISDVIGVDGEWVDISQLTIASERFIPADLGRPLDLGRQFDLALSLEVAEHLPPEAADQFVDSIVTLAPVVVFSAAAPGQGGEQHLNERWPSYWSEVFGRRGYTVVDCLRDRLWTDVRVARWYAQNMLLFASSDAVEAHPPLRGHPKAGVRPLPLVHPRHRDGSRNVEGTPLNRTG